MLAAMFLLMLFCRFGYLSESQRFLRRVCKPISRRQMGTRRTFQIQICQQKQKAATCSHPDTEWLLYILIIAAVLKPLQLPLISMNFSDIVLKIYSNPDAIINNYTVKDCRYTVFTWKKAHTGKWGNNVPAPAGSNLSNYCCQRMASCQFDPPPPDAFDPVGTFIYRLLAHSLFTTKRCGTQYITQHDHVRWL